jgi:DNA polymerase-3 subunit epsilon
MQRMMNETLRVNGSSLQRVPVWANQALYDLKDHLKKRGYKWSAREDGDPRAWYIDVSQGQQDAEIAFLHSEIYRYDAPVTTRRVDAYDRFSARA